MIDNRYPDFTILIGKGHAPSPHARVGQQGDGTGGDEAVPKDHETVRPRYLRGGQQ